MKAVEREESVLHLHWGKRLKDSLFGHRAPVGALILPFRAATAGHHNVMWVCGGAAIMSCHNYRCDDRAAGWLRPRQETDRAAIALGASGRADRKAEIPSSQKRRAPERRGQIQHGLQRGVCADLLQGLGEVS